MADTKQITGAELVARSLRALGVTTVFGLTGFPITAILEQIINHGIKFIGFRNEQAASYAATAYGYLTNKPACCIVVGGPGVVHAMAGVVNSTGNCFPMLLLAGSSHTYSVGKGDFQELDAITLLAPHVKVALRPPTPQAIPAAIRQAYRMAWHGRLSTGFVDLPADYLQARVSPGAVVLPRVLVAPTVPFPDAEKVAKIASLIKSAAAPLVVVGKGSAYARSENILRELVNSTQLPFLPSPMGKGVIPDSHPCNTSASRSTALRFADVVLVLGARLNWIMHFGEAPKWNAAARMIQVDIDPDVIGQNAGDVDLGVVADVNVFAKSLISQLQSWKYSAKTQFWERLAKERAANESRLAVAAEIKSTPLTFEHSFHVIRTVLDSLSPPPDGGIVYVSEGARTMDTSRQWFFQEHPRLRLDAGTLGTMGIGFGYAIAAWEAYNGRHAEASSGKKGRKKVVGIIGDSATGFSGMEVETMARYGMDCLIFVMNNGGVYHGHADSKLEYDAQRLATSEGRSGEGMRSWSLGYETQYNMFADAVGGKGYLVRTSEELRQAAEEGFKLDVPVIVNVLTESGKGFPAVFGFELAVPEEKDMTKPESKL